MAHCLLVPGGQPLKTYQNSETKRKAPEGRVVLHQHLASLSGSGRECVALVLSRSRASGLLHRTLPRGLKKEARLSADFSKHAVKVDLFLMMATSLPLGTRNGEVGNRSLVASACVPGGPHGWEAKALLLQRGRLSAAAEPKPGRLQRA